MTKTFSEEKVAKLQKLEELLGMDLLKYLAVLDINEQLEIPLYMIIKSGWYGKPTVQKVGVRWYKLDSTFESIEVQFCYNYGNYLEDANFLDIQERIFLSKEEAEKVLKSEQNMKKRSK